MYGEEDNMPTISSFILCDSIMNIQSPPNGNIPQLISPQAVLRPPFIPGTFSFGIAMCIIGLKAQQQNVFMFQIHSPSGEIIQDSGEIDFGELPFDDSMPEKYNGFVISSDIRNLVIRTEGEYTIELFINKDSIGTCVIPIYKRSER